MLVTIIKSLFKRGTPITKIIFSTNTQITYQKHQVTEGIFMHMFAACSLHVIWCRCTPLPPEY